MKKRLLPLMMAFSLIFPMFSAFADEIQTNTSSPSVLAETAVLIDADSGEIL